ncbi:uncharacterized protein Bfra_012316 [Botrytis fragariae]|uniref:Uncharacterized protein n=1 Tax=Botrytis fragariae TaxID=1964551 RepID=A0A8H6EE09_9HELO|nr:uncharacterized protein Bfra_012316 [Botrytis fragariae]KAF5868668.1 hypothetical protein Bfra_012316 [Botrytis fragariae]
MNPRLNGLASQKPQTASNKSESESKYAFTQKIVLRTLDRKILDEGLRKQWKFFSEDDKMFGSLNIRGGYIAHDMCIWRKYISSSSPKDVLNLKQCLAEKAWRFWEKNPDPVWIPGAKEEEAFVEAYENMVKIIQGIPAEETDNYCAYIEHRLRLATSTEGGEILGPVLHEVLSNKVSNPEMRLAAKKRKSSKEVKAKSLDARSFTLLKKQSLGKRKRLTGDGDDDGMDLVNNSSDRNIITTAAGTSTVYSKPLEDETFKFQIYHSSIPLLGVRLWLHDPFQSHHHRIQMHDDFY